MFLQKAFGEDWQKKDIDDIQVNFLRRAEEGFSENTKYQYYDEFIKEQYAFLFVKCGGYDTYTAGMVCAV